eukprot:13910375-Alexandrium_andersonii.AAC.1
MNESRWISFKGRSSSVAVVALALRSHGAGREGRQALWRGGPAAIGAGGTGPSRSPIHQLQASACGSKSPKQR